MRIFLVEDEVYALKALQKKILDLNEGYEVVGTAGSGTEALLRLPNAHADILLTDIRMPDMDGISLIEELRRRGDPILPVIISGYQEFEYAQSALKLGVKDYLLKPVVPQDLRTCLANCAQVLRSRRTKNNVMSLIINDTAVSLEMPPDQRDLLVVYAILSNALTNLENVLHPDVPLLASEKVSQLFGQIFPAGTLIQCFDGFFSNEKALVIACSENGSVDSLLSAAAQRLGAEYKQSVTLFYAVTSHPEQLASCVRRCWKGAVQCGHLGQNVVASQLPTPLSKPHCAEESGDLLAMLIRQNQRDLLRSNIRRVFRAWQQQQLTTYQIESELVPLLDELRSRLEEVKEFTVSSVFLVENIISFSHSNEELAENFFQLLIELLAHPTANIHAAMGAAELVEEIEDFFRRNLAENITLQSLSDEFQLSKVYLCRVFKKYKNTTPIDYFTHLKIERAKTMLKSYPGISLREVADSLGFNDSYYFSKVFKRIVGASPSEFQDSANSSK